MSRFRIRVLWSQEAVLEVEAKDEAEARKIVVERNGDPALLAEGDDPDDADFTMDLDHGTCRDCGAEIEPEVDVYTCDACMDKHEAEQEAARR